MMNAAAPKTYISKRMIEQYKEQRAVRQNEKESQSK